MIKRHNRMTGASLGFVKTLLSASYQIFLMSVLTSMYNPQASGLASDAPKKVDSRENIELYDRTLRRKKNIFTRWLNPQHWFFLLFLYHLFFVPKLLCIFLNKSHPSLFHFWKTVNFYLSSEFQIWNWSHSPQLPWISVQLLFFISLPCFITFSNHCGPCTTQRAM